MYFPYVLLETVFTGILLINFQPYKHSVAHYTTVDVSFLVLLSLFYVTIVGNNIVSNRKRFVDILNGLAAISCITPIIYTNFITLHWIYVYPKKKWGGMFLMFLSSN